MNGFFRSLPYLGPRTYEFSVADKTLTMRGCNIAGGIDLTVHLTDEAAAHAVMCVQELSSCSDVDADVGCFANPYPQTQLTVRTTASLSTIYRSDRLGSCNLPPYISDASLHSFENCIYGIIVAACPADGGTDAGACSRGDPADEGDSGGCRL